MNALRTGSSVIIAAALLGLGGCGGVEQNIAAASDADTSTPAPDAGSRGAASEIPAVEGRGPYTGFIVTFDRRIVRVQYEEIAGLAVVGGDMIIGTHEEMQERAALLSDMQDGELDRPGLSAVQQKSFSELAGRAEKAGAAVTAPQYANLLVNILGWATMDPVWPSRIIPYEIASNIPSDPADPRRANIAKAVAMWNSQSPMQLRPASSVSPADAQRGILVFVDHPTSDQYFACMSAVGHHPQGGRQNLYINPKCEAGNIAHEVGHALGLHHEHQRSDRTALLSVNAKVPQDTRNYAPIPGRHMTPHDLCSIMHYASDTTKPAWFDLTPEGRRAHQSCAPSLPDRADCRDVGQRCQLSPADVESIKKLYGA